MNQVKLQIPDLFMPSRNTPRQQSKVPGSKMVKGLWVLVVGLYDLGFRAGATRALSCNSGGACDNASAVYKS